jgi:hypothetical protein
MTVQKMPKKSIHVAQNNFITVRIIEKSTKCQSSWRNVRGAWWNQGCSVADTVGAKSITRFLKSMYFCGKISQDTGMVESSGFLFDRPLPGKSYRGEESYKYLTIGLKRPQKTRRFFFTKSSAIFKKPFFLRNKIEENILMDLT